MAEGAKEGVSRRNFLQGAGAAAATVAMGFRSTIDLPDIPRPTEQEKKDKYTCTIHGGVIVAYSNGQPYGYKLYKSSPKLPEGNQIAGETGQKPAGFTVFDQAELRRARLEAMEHECPVVAGCVINPNSWERDPREVSGKVLSKEQLEELRTKYEALTDEELKEAGIKIEGTRNVTALVRRSALKQFPLDQVSADSNPLSIYFIDGCTVLDYSLGDAGKRPFNQVEYDRMTFIKSYQDGLVRDIAKNQQLLSMAREAKNQEEIKRIDDLLISLQAQFYACLHQENENFSRLVQKQVGIGGLFIPKDNFNPENMIIIKTGKSEGVKIATFVYNYDGQFSVVEVPINWSSNYPQNKYCMPLGQDLLVDDTGSPYKFFARGIEDVFIHEFSHFIGNQRNDVLSWLKQTWDYVIGKDEYSNDEETERRLNEVRGLPSEKADPKLYPFVLVNLLTGECSLVARNSRLKADSEMPV